MAIGKHRLALEQLREGQHRVAALHRRLGLLRFAQELVDGPGAHHHHARLAIQEGLIGSGVVEVGFDVPLGVELLHQLERIDDSGLLHVYRLAIGREELRVLLRHQGEEGAVVGRRLVGHGPRKHGLARAFAEAPGLGQQLVRRMWHQRLTVCPHQAGLLHQARVDVPEPGPGIEGQGIGLALERGAAPRMRSEVVHVDAHALEIHVQRQHQLAAHVVAQRGLMHHRDRRNVLGHQACGELVVVGAPFTDLGAHDDAVGVRRVELIDQGRDDPALAHAFGRLQDLAEPGLAAAEEAHQRDLGLAVFAGALPAAGEQGQAEHKCDSLEHRLHHCRPVPATAVIRCFWKNR